VNAHVAKLHATGRDCRANLLAVAGEIFAERGFEAATVKEITDRAGANVASVNYYFGDKLSLYIEVLRLSLHNGRMALPPESEGLSPEERLAYYIDRFLKTLTGIGRPSWASQLALRELTHPSPALPQLVEDIFLPNFLLMRRLIADVAAAPLEADTLDLLTHSITAQCTHWKLAKGVLTYLRPEENLNEPRVTQIARQIADFSIAGIRAAAAKWRNSQ
jgi:AcrR family transcriptional regulator